jgi:glycogen debranching enzyme
MWSFESLRSSLPSPVYDEEPSWISTYWKAWEIAFRNFHEPEPGSGFVSPFIDAAFNENIFLWDSCFMTMFTSAAHPVVPGIGTLDNFYARQHPDGEISREIRRDTGEDFSPWQNTEGGPLVSRWGFNIPGQKGPFRLSYRGREPPAAHPRLTLDALNHPILAWAEIEHLRWSGDRERIRRVFGPLERYRDALRTYLLQGNGLLMTDWASMDNSPRNPHLDGGGTGVDISSEMVLFARNLAEMAELLGERERARALRAEADELAGLIRALMWSPERRFYFDLAADGRQAPVKTVAAYWTLLAGVASADQAEALVTELGNPATFGRLNPVPTCSADEPAYEPGGGYWRGAVWAPIVTMVVRGLERCGHGELARKIALRHVRLVADVHAKTGTIWENYAPDSAEPGRHVDGRSVARDFVGWSGIGPILFLLEHAVGLRPDAPVNALDWGLRTPLRCGCEGYRFGGHVASLVADQAAGGPRRVTVTSDGPFQLRLRWKGEEKSVGIPRGRTSLSIGGG